MNLEYALDVFLPVCTFKASKMSMRFRVIAKLSKTIDFHFYTP
jgi:hypothetical protein